MTGGAVDSFGGRASLKIDGDAQLVSRRWTGSLRLIVSMDLWLTFIHVRGLT